MAKEQHDGPLTFGVPTDASSAQSISTSSSGCVPLPEGICKPPGMCSAEPSAIQRALAAPADMPAVDALEETHAMPAPVTADVGPCSDQSSSDKLSAGLSAASDQAGPMSATTDSSMPPCPVPQASSSFSAERAALPEEQAAASEGSQTPVTADREETCMAHALVTPAPCGDHQDSSSSIGNAINDAMTDEQALSMSAFSDGSMSLCRGSHVASAPPSEAQSPIIEGGQTPIPADINMEAIPAGNNESCLADDPMTPTPGHGQQLVSSRISADTSDNMTEDEATAYLAKFAAGPAPAAGAASSSRIPSGSSARNCIGSSLGSCSGSPSPVSTVPCHACLVQELIHRANTPMGAVLLPVTCIHGSSAQQAAANAETKASQASSVRREACLAHDPIDLLPHDGHWTTLGKDSGEAMTDEEADLGESSLGPAPAAPAVSSAASCCGSTSSACSTPCQACILRELIHLANLPVGAFVPPVLYTHSSGSSSGMVAYQARIFGKDAAGLADAPLGPFHTGDHHWTIGSSIGKGAGETMRDEEADLAKLSVTLAPAALAASSGSTSSTPCRACILRELIERAQAPIGAFIPSVICTHNCSSSSSSSSSSGGMCARQARGSSSITSANKQLGLNPWAAEFVPGHAWGLVA